MCSTPKGGSSTKPLLSTHVESLSADMSSADYSNMVHRANESYEHRQRELKEYRKTHKKRLPAMPEKSPELSILEKIKLFLGYEAESRPVDSK